MGEAKEQLWRVTLTREIEVFVAAPTSEDAERIADDADDSGDIDWGDTHTETNACACTMLGAADRDENVYSDDADEDRTAGDVLDGRPPPEQHRREWEARRPTALADLLPWFAEAPTLSGAWNRPWWGSIDGGAAACDGHAALFVEGAAGPADTLVRGRDPWHARGSRVFAEAMAETGPVATVSVETLRAWATLPADDTLALGRILGTPLNRRKVAAWVLPAAEIDGGPVTVAVTRAVAHASALLFSGAGWRALVMPLAEDTAMECVPLATEAA